MKLKKTNYENGVSFYLTSSTKSYTELAKELESILLNKIGIKADITSRRVKEWAHGTLPQGAELDAICLHRFDDKEKWRDLYFPSTDFTLKFIKYISIEQVNRTLESSQIELFIQKRDLASMYNGLNDKDVTLNTLASILIMKIYYQLRNKDLISKTKEEDYSFKNYKKAIIEFLKQKLENIDPECMFIKNSMSALKRKLIKDGTNRANIRREAIKQIISII